MRHPTFALLLLAACGADTQLDGNGTLGAEPRTVSTFSGVAIEETLSAELTVGPPAVVLALDTNLLPRTRTAVEGGVLRIGSDDPAVALVPSDQAVVRVTSPALDHVEATGHARIEGAVQGGTVALHASDASSLDLTVTASASVTVHASDAARVRVHTAAKLVVRASGASVVTVVGSPVEPDVQLADAAKVEYVSEP